MIDSPRDQNQDASALLLGQRDICMAYDHLFRRAPSTAYRHDVCQVIDMVTLDSRLLDFSHRRSRGSFALHLLLVWTLFWIICGGGLAVVWTSEGWIRAFATLAPLIALPLLWPLAALCVQRIRDMGWPPHAAMALPLPGIGQVVFIVMLFHPSRHGKTTRIPSWLTHLAPQARNGRTPPAWPSLP